MEYIKIFKYNKIEPIVMLIALVGTDSQKTGQRLEPPSAAGNFYFKPVRYQASFVSSYYSNSDDELVKPNIKSIQNIHQIETSPLKSKFFKRKANPEFSFSHYLLLIN